MRIVVGCNRHHAGTHPLNMNIGPSVLMAVRMACIVDVEPGAEAFMILLFITSAGEHTVVATVPAANEAVKWRPIPSSM